MDSTAVILITHYYANALPIDEAKPLADQLLVFIASGYAFKFVVALLDTLPLYLGCRWLSEYLKFDPLEELKKEAADRDEDHSESA